jgi:WD40-like Beta Propeller Repeat
MSGIVYFDRGVEPPPSVPVQQIVSVPLQGGPLTVVAQGHEPVVSPNGRLLAYLADTDFTDAHEAVEVRNLETGATTTWQYPNAAADISGLTWTPDSRTLAFTATTPTPNKTGATLGTSVLDVSTHSGSLEAARPIPLPQCPSPPPWDFPGAPRTMAWAGYLNETEGIGVCRRGSPLTGQSYEIELSVVAVATGRIIAHLPAISGQLDVGSVLDGSEGEVQVDASGRHLAIVEVGSGTGTLYRWSLGNDLLPTSAEPVRVTTGASSPAWVPLP